MRALSAAIGLTLLTPLSVSPVLAQNIPQIPEAPTTPEEARTLSEGQTTTPQNQNGNASGPVPSEVQDVFGVPTAGGVAVPEALPATIDLSLPDDAEDREATSIQIGDTSILYDTKSIAFGKDFKTYSFDGDIVLIGGGYVITADTIDVNMTTNVMDARGHVLIIHQNQVFSGDRIELKWESGDFTITNAILVASDPAKIREMSQKILGLTPEELAYETAKKARISSLAKEREELRENFRNDPEPEPSKDLLQRYTRLLEEDLITSKAMAPSLAQQDSERRKRFESRRIFWERGRAEAEKNSPATNIYFRLSGGSIERRDGNTYTARDAIFTPCICADDESPAWGFQADEIVAQQEGYINLKHPILTIKGVPLIYLPYLKLPLKTKRQSGFLMPSFQSGQVKNGFVYSQPVFLDLAPNADATVTADLFQKRGTRIGVETRYEAKTSSGFKYQAETIRDRSWLQQSGYRRDLVDFFSTPPNQPEACSTLVGLEQEECLRNSVVDPLTPPSNTWRGKQEWSGRYNFAPRLSLVTKGKVVSDHRYLDDLYLPEEVVTAFAPKASANAFSTAKAKLNFDGKDFYLGLKSSYGDNSLYSRQYAGQQLPAALTLQSRYLRLFPASWWSVPSYGEFKLQMSSVEDRQLALADRKSEDATLGSGQWNRLSFKVVTPVMTEGIFKVSHFADAELRYIRHNALPYDLDAVDNSTIRSWKTGLTFDLPIDGTGPLPSLFQSDEPGAVRYGQHIMNWGLTLSERPMVVRDGPYGDLTDARGAPLVYFPSDRNRLFTNEDVDVRDEDVMVKHRRVTIRTSHRWRFFERADEAMNIETPTVDEYESELANLQEQARLELLAMKDRSVSSVDQMYQQNELGRVDWLVRRYKSVDRNNIEPINFSAQISYDNEQEKLRRKQIQENARLEEEALAADEETAARLRAQKVGYAALYESWIGPSAYLGLNYEGFSLDTSVLYNLYKKTSTSLGFALGLPTFYSTQFGLRYVLEKKANLDPGTDTLLFARTRTTTLGAATSIIPMITVGANLIREQVDGQEDRYGTSYQIGYDDRSGCWGLRFLREKDLNQPEEDANYILQLAVIFLGNRRGVDISPGLEREIRGDEAVRSANR